MTNSKMTIDEIINELRHYTNSDLMELSIYQLLEMWWKLTEENQEEEEE